MAQPVYSERFVAYPESEIWLHHYCPAGKRLVIETLTAANFGETGAQIYLVVAEVLCVYYGFPATAVTEIWRMRAVLYAGERLSVYGTGTNIQAICSGYELDDPGAILRPAPPPSVPPLDPATGRAPARL